MSDAAARTEEFTRNAVRMHVARTGQSLADLAELAGVAYAEVHEWFAGTSSQHVTDAIRVALRAAAHGGTTTQRVESAELVDQMTAQQRILTESRMTSESTLTPIQIDTIRADFAAYLDRSGTSQARVAKAVDVVPSVINEFVRSVYRGDSAALAKRLNAWMEQDARRRSMRGAEGYIPTVVAERIRTVIRHADAACVMAAIVAPAGVGKTFVAQAVADEMRGLYLAVDDSTTPRALLRRLASMLGKRVTGTEDDLKHQVCEALKGSGRPVLIDEAHQLSARAVGKLRSIHDNAGVPVIMLGTAAILDAVDDRIDGRGQYSSRCMRFNVMQMAKGISGPDGTECGHLLFSIEEVRAFFAKQPMRLDKEALDYAHAITCLSNQGTLRLALKVAQLAASSGKDVTAKRMRAAFYTFLDSEAPVAELMLKQISRALSKKGSGGDERAARTA